MTYIIGPGTPGVSQTFGVNLSYAGLPCTYEIYVKQTCTSSGGGMGCLDHLLGSFSLSGTSYTGTINIPFTPVESTNIRVEIIAYSTSACSLSLYGIYYDKITYVPMLVTSTICNDDGYAYGYNGQMKVNEWAGLGNHTDYGARGLDTRTGRWSSPDKLQAKYPTMSSYAYCASSPILFVDPDGNKVHVYISSEPVGTTQIRLIQGSGSNGGAPKTVEVPLYKMTVTSDATKKVSTYFVTRDAPLLNQTDPIDEGWLWNPDKYNVVNTSFEPKKDNAVFNLIPLAYPEGMEAYALRNPDGSKKFAAEPNESPFRKKKDEADGVMIHVGGTYVDAGGNTRITGSEGCFTLSGPDQGNAGTQRFVSDINARKKQDKAAGKGNDVELKIKKRTDVQNSWQVTKNGKKK